MGPKMVSIPEFVSLSKKDYFTLLNEVGIKYEEKEIVTSEVKEGLVAKVSKQPGEKIDVEEGEILTVFIAKAPAKTETSEALEDDDTNPNETTKNDTMPEADNREIVITRYN